MSLTTLLDTLADAGKRLGDGTGERRERADQLLLPVWQWLEDVSVLTDRASVDWSTVDESLAPEDEEAIAAALEELIGSLDGLDSEAFESALAKFQSSVVVGVQRAQERLGSGGLEAQSIATVFLPIRRELASWSHREESDQVLTRARDALTEVGASRLALSFNDQFAEDLRQANRFRQGAMAFFMLAVAWSVVASVTLPTDLTLAGGVGRFVIALSLIVVAGFFTRESNRHRADANVWRTVQLQLNAIEAYCAAMPRSRAELLRFLLGASVFSGPRLYAAAAGRSFEKADHQSRAVDSPENATLDGSLRELLAIVREVSEASRASRQAG